MFGFVLLEVIADIRSSILNMKFLRFSLIFYDVAKFRVACKLTRERKLCRNEKNDRKNQKVLRSLNNSNEANIGK